MNQPTVLMKTSLSSTITLFKRGKVRDNYDLGKHLLVVATDRISAFDVVMPNGIPGKGRILTQMSVFWFDWIRDNLPDLKTHFITDDWNLIVFQHPQLRPFKEQLAGRSILVEKVRKVLPVEAVVRGYLYGSGWKDYLATAPNHQVCGILLPPDMKQADKLPQPFFTPATKAETGHDENIDWQTAVKLLGEDIALEVKGLSLTLYIKASEYADSRGIIVPDTKFEFGFDEHNGIMLIDEVLTPDSSRFWRKQDWQPGGDQPSLDKQFVREHLERLVALDQWDKNPPGPKLPPEIVEGTVKRYQQALEMLTG